MSDAGTETEGGRGWTPGRVLVVTVVLVLVLFWIWVFAGGPRRANPDRLEDRGWVERAATTCRATRTRIDALPDAQQAADATARARVVDLASDELDVMLDQLADRSPTGDDDAGLVDQWLVDWRVYLGDRRDYATRLRRDPDAQLLVTEKFSDPIETVIATFAEVNDMEVCAPPGDIA